MEKERNREREREERNGTERARERGTERNRAECLFLTRAERRRVRNKRNGASESEMVPCCAHRERAHAASHSTRTHNTCTCIYFQYTQPCSAHMGAP